MKKTESVWPFQDAPNVAVFTDQRIIDGSSWIYYVGHDEDDGAWQFHVKEGTGDEAYAKLVGLKTVFEIDASIAELADLPLGWCAWRENSGDEWKRAPQ